MYTVHVHVHLHVLYVQMCAHSQLTNERKLFEVSCTLCWRQSCLSFIVLICPMNADRNNKVKRRELVRPISLIRPPVPLPFEELCNINYTLLMWSISSPTDLCIFHFIWVISIYVSTSLSLNCTSSSNCPLMQ